MDRYKVLVVIGDGFKQVEEMFVKQGWELTTDIDDADLVQFCGGADVNPALYRQHRHFTTHPDFDRDERERTIYFMALERGIPMAGICRGGQLLNVLNGGTLYQDVDGHQGMATHKAWLIGGMLPIEVTSTHHQMMVVNLAADHVIVMTAQESKNRYYMSTDTMGAYQVQSKVVQAKPSDPECVFYRDTRCLCFQPHPEYSGGHAIETREVYFDLLERYLFSDAVDELMGARA